MTLIELFKLVNEKTKSKATELKVPEDNKLKSGLTNTAIFAALTYYLGINTEYFSSGAQVQEIPVYLIYGCLGLMSITNLESICGKPSVKSSLGNTVSGGVSGASLGGVIASIALGLAGDIIVTGGLATIGAVLGFYRNKNGKKVHECGKKLPCTTWICTQCKYIIKPSKEWRYKERWDILDICDYLDTSGYRMNSLKAISFMSYIKILDNLNRFSTDTPVQWKPADIRQMTEEKSDEFTKKFISFLESNEININDENLNIDSFFNQWGSFLNEEKSVTEE